MVVVFPIMKLECLIHTHTFVYQPLYCFYTLSVMLTHFSVVMHQMSILDQTARSCHIQ